MKKGNINMEKRFKMLGFKNGNPTDISEQNYRPIRDKRFIVIDLKNN